MHVCLSGSDGHCRQMFQPIRRQQRVEDACSGFGKRLVVSGDATAVLTWRLCPGTGPSVTGDGTVSLSPTHTSTCRVQLTIKKKTFINLTMDYWQLFIFLA